MIPTVNPGQLRIRVGKVPFDVSTIQGAVDRIMLAAENREGIPVRLSNAYCVALASKDSEYERLLGGHGLNFPDGAPVAWVMKARNRSNIPVSRVRGPSFFFESIARSHNTQIRHFFLGTTDETLSSLVRTLKSEYPELNVAGTYAPPFAPLSESFIQDCYERIKESRADIVWVGLGTPKQDFVAAQLAARLDVPCAGVGAAFDFAAGTVREAPAWIQRSGTEWLYRLMSEPKRLWKRYLFGNARFIYSALAESAK